MATPKYLTKNPVGKPLKFKTVKDLEAAVNTYFDYCKNRTKEIHSEKMGDMVVSDPECPTMSGLAYALGIDRRSLLNYANRDQYFPTIREARSRIEAEIEARLVDKEKFTTGQIFNLKNNFDWKDESKIDQVLHMPKPIMEIGEPDAIQQDNSDQEDN